MRSLVLVIGMLGLIAAPFFWVRLDTPYVLAVWTLLIIIVYAYFQLRADHLEHERRDKEMEMHIRILERQIEELTDPVKRDTRSHDGP